MFHLLFRLKGGLLLICLLLGFFQLTLAEAPDSGVEQGNKLSSLKDSDVPVFITSDSVTLDSKKRVFTYTGNVKATRADMVLTCQTMVGNYDETNAIRDVTCVGDVVIIKGVALRATSNRAVYDVKSDTVILTEGPTVVHNGSALNADRITLFVQEERSEAEGNVSVKVLSGQTGGLDVDAVKGGLKKEEAIANDGA